MTKKKWYTNVAKRVMISAIAVCRISAALCRAIFRRDNTRSVLMAAMKPLPSSGDTPSCFAVKDEI